MQRPWLWATGLLFPALVALAQPEPFAAPAPAEYGASDPVSMEVVNDGAAVYSRPQSNAERRGRLKAGTRVPFVRRRMAEGCETGMWFELEPNLFSCERHYRPSSLPPHGEPQPVVPPGELVPYQYAFVRYDATPAYASVDDYYSGTILESLGEGFGVVVVDRTSIDGLPFYQTRRGLFIEANVLAMARPSSFTGIHIGEGEPLDHAWVLRPTAIRASARGRVVGRAERRAVLHVAEVVAGGMARLVDGTFVRTRDLARAELAAPPAELFPMERWIDVHVDQQVLVAYEGRYPRFATLVSTGRAGVNHATPLGLHRIWVKLAMSDMSNLAREDLDEYYAMEQVPWVQYFEGSNGFHAAFWHDDFGQRRSHGCVNLSPIDAAYLFRFTGPTLPDGWDAVFATDSHPGTLVQIR